MKKVTKGVILATAAAALLAAGCASQSCPNGKCSKPGHHSSCKGVSSCKAKKKSDKGY